MKIILAEESLCSSTFDIQNHHQADTNLQLRVPVTELQVLKVVGPPLSAYSLQLETLHLYVNKLFFKFGGTFEV